MFLALPWDSWVLLVVAIGAGLAIELAFYRRHHAGRAANDSDSTGR